MVGVLKFGGSSLESAQKIKQVCAFIKEKQLQFDGLIVVVSAMGKTTNSLEKLLKDLGRGDDFAYAAALTMGENLSAAAVKYGLSCLGVNSQVFDAKSAGIRAKGSPLVGIITGIDKSGIERTLKKNEVAIVTGFQGEKNGKIVCLGRGGSDTTATALAAVFDGKLEIYTDVDGFYTLDPAIFAFSKKLEKINIHSAIELSTIGAKVLDKRCLCLANRQKCNMQVLKSCTDSKTEVLQRELEGECIDGISFKSNVSLVHGLCGKKLKEIIENQQLLFCKAQGRRVLAAIDDGKGYLDAVIISGSGFTLFPRAAKEVVTLAKSMGIFVKLIDVQPTFIKLVIGRGKTREFVQKLGENLSKI